jgi:hypothetical protein
VRCYSWTFLLGGVSSATVAVILWSVERGSLVWLIFSFAMLGKFLIAAAFAIAYLFTAELFPTPVRYACSSLGSLAGEFLTLIFRTWWQQ